MAITISALFAAWMALAVAVQLPSSPLRRARNLGVLGNLIPAWNFFAPRPAQGDFEVRYRTGVRLRPKAADTEWKLLDSWGDRHPLQLIFYPDRRSKHALFGCCSRIVKSIRRNGSSQMKVMVSAPYLLILAHASAQAAKGDEIQFRIDFVSRRPDRSGQTAGIAQKIVFQSAIHRRNPRPGTYGGKR
jgi:hypothetical protein